MNFSLVKSQIYHISKFLDVSALSLIPKIIWVNLIQNRMKAYFLAIPLLVKPIECLINAQSMYVRFNETNPHISKIIEEADISCSGDPGRIDPANRNSDPTSRNFDPTSNEQIYDE